MFRNRKTGWTEQIEGEEEAGAGGSSEKTAESLGFYFMTEGAGEKGEDEIWFLLWKDPQARAQSDLEQDEEGNLCLLVSSGVRAG